MKNFLQKIWNKICTNKLVAFIVFLLFAAIIFIAISFGSDYIEKVMYSTQNGGSILFELFALLVTIFLLLIFKNNYILYEKKKSLKESFKLVVPIIIFYLAVGYMMFSTNSLNNIDIDELIAILILFLLVGCFEELLCRGWVQNELIEKFGYNRKGVIYSIVAASIIFSFLHAFNFISGHGSVIQLLTTFTSGLFFGVIYYKTKNIMVPILLHGIWDICLSVSELEAVQTCVNVGEGTQGPSIFLGIALLFIVGLPELLIALKFFSKSSINEELKDEYKEVLTEQQILYDQKREKRITTGYKIILGIISGLLIIGGTFLMFNQDKNDECTVYQTKEMGRKSYLIFESKEYKLELNTTSIDFKIDDYNELTYEFNGKKSTIPVYYIKHFGVTKKDNKYIVMVLANYEGSGIVYYSDYITEDNINNDDFIGKFNSSFTLLKLPSIYRIGLYDLQYPFFLGDKNDYIMIDNTIYTLKQK